jgi:hypothetical protein
MRRALKRKNENIDTINNLVYETKKRLTECQVETEQKTIELTEVYGELIKMSSLFFYFK